MRASRNRRQSLLSCRHAANILAGDPAGCRVVSDLIVLLPARSFTIRRSSEEVNMPDNISDKGKTTGAVNGGLWGARARDWAELQEGQCRPVYEAVLDRLKVGPAMAYLDAGCGAGMAAQMAQERGAKVSGLDASEPLLAIARERVPGGTVRRRRSGGVAVCRCDVRRGHGI